MRRRLFLYLLLSCLTLGVFSQGAGAIHATPRSARDKLRITWEIVPDAVGYRVSLLDSEARGAKVLHLYTPVYATGLELPASSISEGATHYRVQGYDCNGDAIGAPITAPLTQAMQRPTAPLALDEYAQMSYLPVYPVFSWVPVDGATSYEVELWEEDTRLRHFYTYESLVYDELGMRRAGSFWWRVRALDEQGRQYSDWCAPVTWEVTAPTPIVALGDSITHGGGAISTPPCRALYSWQTYCAVPVKNAGYSGDTTEEMADRFANDVLPFAPQVLVIMGGVNDFRVGIDAEDTIAELARIAAACEAHDITPVFVTATPICPARMEKYLDIEPVAENWQEAQQAINAWVLAQPHAIDVATPLTDTEGNLREEMTSDGLHPDYAAKCIIGECIGAYLAAHFAHVYA